MLLIISNVYCTLLLYPLLKYFEEVGPIKWQQIIPNTANLCRHSAYSCVLPYITLDCSE